MYALSLYFRTAMLPRILLTLRKRILIEDEASTNAGQTQSDRVLDLAAGPTSEPAKLVNDDDAKAGAITCPSKFKLGYRVR